MPSEGGHARRGRKLEPTIYLTAGSFISHSAVGSCYSACFLTIAFSQVGTTLQEARLIRSVPALTKPTLCGELFVSKQNLVMPNSFKIKAGNHCSLVKRHNSGCRKTTSSLSKMSTQASSPAVRQPHRRIGSLRSDAPNPPLLRRIARRSRTSPAAKEALL